MRIERVGVIFPEPAQIPEIKNWLKPYTSLVHIASFTGLPQAVPLLSEFRSDLLIVADRFPEAQGLILFKGLRKLCPNAQIIMLATGLTPIRELSSPAMQDSKLVYFPQPWDKQSLLAHIEAAIGIETPVFTTALALEDGQYQRISQLLDDLQKKVSALSIYLVNELGQVLDYKGRNELTQIGEISSLLGGSFAALQQLGTTLGEHSSAASLIHRQGEKEDLYALSVGAQALLVLRFSHDPNAPRIGTVSFYARQTVAELSKVIEEDHPQPTGPFLNEETEAALNAELENLFSFPPEDQERKQSKPKPARRLLDFKRAVEEGLVSKSLIARLQSNKEIQ